jgi:hypothetical protein|tara:strand:- start:3 stop:137 length:135 start_codon:yes stop_codon:yes gene_type:complete
MLRLYDVMLNWQPNGVLALNQAIAVWSNTAELAHLEGRRQAAAS